MDNAHAMSPCSALPHLLIRLYLQLVINYGLSACFAAACSSLVAGWSGCAGAHLGAECRRHRIRPARTAAAARAPAGTPSTGRWPPRAGGCGGPLVCPGTCRSPRPRTLRPGSPPLSMRRALPAPVASGRCLSAPASRGGRPCVGPHPHRRAPGWAGTPLALTAAAPKPPPGTPRPSCHPAARCWCAAAACGRGSCSRSACQTRARPPGQQTQQRCRPPGEHPGPQSSLVAPRPRRAERSPLWQDR
mmetsp:Transcript_23918/g.60173  ORF Transcript_23918/g.60173 Transcript_23918/m.60173 type:complete len:246 (+) Transcript_23918:171-908(+)